ncbi:MAG: hypothetical protein SPI86_09645 [Treponemataceae bacterium]|nr:hypothetical protein [Spirochaetales bacterium]MDY6032005.1 hypothetical protein [Treponemataceae bacterium]
MKRFIFSLITLTSLCLTAFSQETINQLPQDYYTFRDDMYNFEKSPAQMLEDFNKYTTSAKENYSGYELNFVLARFEYIMGRVYYYANDLTSAGKHYDAGMIYGEKAMKENENAQSVLIYAENLSANCTTKPTSWVITNGAKIAGLTKKVLKYDPRNGAAIYMANGQDVYAPAPFNNIKRGVKTMQDILSGNDYDLGKDDEFNLTSSVGFGYSLLKDKENARIWYEKSLKIYPNNKYILGLLADL